VKVRTVSAWGIEATRDELKGNPEPKRRAARLENEHEPSNLPSIPPATLPGQQLPRGATKRSNAQEIGKQTTI